MYEETHFEGVKPDYKLVLKLRSLALENILLEKLVQTIKEEIPESNDFTLAVFLGTSFGIQIKTLKEYCFELIDYDFKKDDGRNHFSELIKEMEDKKNIWSKSLKMEGL